MSLGNMWPVSTTSPKVILFLFLHFSRTQLLAYSLEKYLYLVLTPRSTTVQLTLDANDNLACWTALWQSPSLIKFMFLILQMNNPNNRENLPQIQQFLSPTRGITRISQYSNHSHLYHKFLVETHWITRIFGIGHQLHRFSQIIQSIHYSYRHLLNRQCWEWYWTIIPMLFRQFSTAASTDG